MERGPSRSHATGRPRLCKAKTKQTSLKATDAVLRCTSNRRNWVIFSVTSILEAWEGVGVRRCKGSFFSRWWRSIQLNDACGLKRKASEDGGFFLLYWPTIAGFVSLHVHWIIGCFTGQPGMPIFVFLGFYFHDPRHNSRRNRKSRGRSKSEGCMRRRRWRKTICAQQRIEERSRAGRRRGTCMRRRLFIMSSKEFLQPFTFPCNHLCIVGWGWATLLPVTQSRLAIGSQDVLASWVRPRQELDWKGFLWRRTEVDELLGEHHESCSLEDCHGVCIGNVPHGGSDKFHKCLMWDFKTRDAFILLSFWIVLVINHNAQLMHDEFGCCPPTGKISCNRGTGPIITTDKSCCEIMCLEKQTLWQWVFNDWKKAGGLKPLFQDGLWITNVAEGFLFLDGLVTNFSIIKDCRSGLVEKDSTKEVKLRGSAELPAAPMISWEHHGNYAGKRGFAHTRFPQKPQGMSTQVWKQFLQDVQNQRIHGLNCRVIPIR